MAALTVDLRKDSGQNQQMTWWPNSSLTVETSHWTSSNMDSVPLHSSSRLWDLDFQMKYNIYFHLKRGLWTTELFIFLLGQGKMFLTMFLFQKWLGSPFPEDVWVWWLLMHWLQLQFTPCEALPSVWIGFAWQYSQACGHPCCLCTFSYPHFSFQSTLHLICFDTALIEQSPLLVMKLCDLPSLWRVSMSSRPLPSQQSSPLLWFQRTRDTHTLYCMNGYSFKLKCKYSNILRFRFLTFTDFWLSWAVSSNHQN